MKLGLCEIDVASEVGGDFVFREAIVQEAAARTLRHPLVRLRARYLPQEFEEPAGALTEAEHAPLPSLAKNAFSNPRALVEGLRTRMRRSIYTQVVDDYSKHALRAYIDWSLNRVVAPPNPDRLRTFEADLKREKIDLLWFISMEPIHVGIPYIYTIFDLQHRLQPWFPEVSANGLFRLREAAFAEALQRAAYVVVASEECGDQVEFFYRVPRDRVRVIPFFTPPAALNAAAKGDDLREGDLRAKYGIEAPYLFYPAQMWPHKNHVNLLRAVKVLKEEHGATFSVAFTGAEREHTAFVRQTAAELGLAEQVHFLGQIELGEIASLYRHAFALTYVTRFGPDNLPPLEAMALGCPAILSDTPGVKSLFGDAVLTANPDDEHAIAACVRTLQEDPARKKSMIEVGHQLARSRTTARYLDAVQDLCDTFEPIRRTWA